MSQDFVTTGRVEAGTLKIRNKRELKQALAHWKDGDVQITIERQHAVRSQAMNRLYWAVYVEALSQHTGYTPTETHELLKAMFLPKKLAVQADNGEIVAEFVIGGSTTKLNKIEFGDYLRDIKQWAGEKLNVEIPEAEPV